MRTVRVVGIGSGDPRQLTIEAAEALGAADVVLLLHRPTAADELTAMRARIVERFAPRARVAERDDAVRDRADPGYTGAVSRWREDRTAIYEAMLTEDVGEQETAAVLVWGDPAIYDGTVDMLHRIEARGHVALAWDVIAGISAPSALAAAHRTTLTRTAAAVTVAPARRVAAGHDVPGDGHDVVIMLDAPDRDGLDDLPDSAVVYWGADVSTPDEVLVSGPLGEVREQLRAAREEVRRRKGWVMDTCLVRGT